jgi:hypothetical protein
MLQRPREHAPPYRSGRDETNVTCQSRAGGLPFRTQGSHEAADSHARASASAGLDSRVARHLLPAKRAHLRRVDLPGAVMVISTALLSRTSSSRCSLELGIPPPPLWTKASSVGREPVAVGSAGGAGAARPCRLAWFPPAADIEPCMRFSRTRLPDVLHRWAFSVPGAMAGWVVARRWFR